MKAPMILLTVITENLLREQFVALFKRHGATGFTSTRVDGEGSRGVHAAEWEGPNAKFEIIASQQTADAILEEIADRYFEDYSVIAWQSEVQVLRGKKFSA